jgi:hypothetical protein
MCVWVCRWVSSVLFCVYVGICLRISTYMCVCVCWYVRLYVSVPLYVCLCMSACGYIYVCVYFVGVCVGLYY